MTRHVAIVLALCAALTGCSRSHTSQGAPHGHGKDWVVRGPSFHGLEYREGTLDCSECHQLESYCVRCHFAPTEDDVRVPPGSGWRHPNPPTDPVGLAHPGQAAFGEKCNVCHDVVRRYGEGPSPCHDCHGAPTAGHPLPYRDPALHGPGAKHDLTYCRDCHAGTLDANPRFDAPLENLPRGCETCHNDGTAHPSSEPAGRDHTHWYGVRSHADASRLTEGCALCHGAALDGVGGVAPSCTSCHTTSPLTHLDCTSCHGRPPSGAAAPNRAGSHAAHDALQEVAGLCDTCHGGAGNRTDNHYNGTRDVSLPAEFDAKSGAAAFDGTTCSNVSCHGGQTTPAWLAGSITVETDCKKCHAFGTAQYNSYHSGLHDLHVTEQNLFCTNCHNTTKLGVAHFANLKTSVLEGVPSATIGGGTTHVASYAAGSCTPTDAEGCHAAKTWGAPHPVDGSFRDPANHGTAAKAQELTACRECHGNPQTGPNPRFNLRLGRLTAGCETCHNDETAHPSSEPAGRDHTHWYGVYHHDDAQNQAAACTPCHGAALDGVGGVAPSCRTCHTAASPLAAPTSCTSCHGRPPSGVASPNRAGAHAAHTVLAGVADACSTCHTGAGARTALHKNGTPDVSVAAGFGAKSGNPAYSASAGSCANVRCHGGLPSPNWRTDTLNVATGCTLCHSLGTAQYNSYNSGQHRVHVVEERIGCTGCHNTVSLAVNHFTHLDTAALEGPASDTVGGGATSVVSYRAGGSCSPGCHGSRNWFSGGD